MDRLSYAMAALGVERVGAGGHLVQGIEGFHDGAFHPDPRHVDTGEVVAARIGHVVTST
jgi:hypothetical protein